MNSIWTEGIAMPQFETLRGDVKTDVLIIGGGMAGILCAHFLQEQGVDYLLAEGRRICAQITKNTTAKITSQHGLIYHKLVKSAGPELARMYLEANEKAGREYERLCKKIDCDFETKTAYVYSLDNRKKLEKEKDALAKIGFDAKLLETTALPFPDLKIRRSFIR